MVKDYLKLTDDPEEIRAIAERLVKDITVRHKTGDKILYTPLMLQKMREDIDHYSPDASPEEKEKMLYHFIYDYWVYGCTVDEEFYLHLNTKSDSEKREYMEP